MPQQLVIAPGAPHVLVGNQHGEEQRLMAWARIDDGFDDHPKLLGLLEEEGAMAAVGLWTLCLTWAHRNTRKKGKTPGRIPAGLPRRFMGAEGRDVAKLLIAHGLWDEAEDGWQIHDFADYLPNEETREARAAAGRKGAAKRWGNRKPREDGNAEAEPKQNDGNLPSGSHGADSNGEANDGSRARRRAGTIPNGIAPEPTPVPSDEPSVHHETSAAEPADDSEESREDVERLCRHLADRLVANGCKPPTVGKRWRDAARLLMDKDGRTEEQIHKAIDWCQNDSFWKSNVLSMPTLREQYDRLRLQAEEERKTRASPNGRPPARPDIDKRDEWKFSR